MVKYRQGKGCRIASLHGRDIAGVVPSKRGRTCSVYAIGSNGNWSGGDTFPTRAAAERFIAARLGPPNQPK